MAFYDKGIRVASGFDLAGAPVDHKYVVDTLSQADEFADSGVAYEGMQVYCLDDKIIYVYDGSSFQPLHSFADIPEVDLSNYTTLTGAQTITGVKTFTQTIQGNSATASKLATARDIALTGDMSGNTSFDGNENVTIDVTLADTGVTPGTYTKFVVDSKGRVTSGTTLIPSDIPELTLSKITDAGTVADKDVGVSAGNIPILGSDGKLDTAVLPSLAISSTHIVATEAEMLALDAQEGDVAVRTDLPASFILKGADPKVLANWVKLATPTDTGYVASVNGKVGTVTLTTSDIAEGSHLYYTEQRATTNFSNNIAITPVSAMSDGVKVIMEDDILVLDCGNA